MKADSEAMRNFRANVKRIIADTPGLSISKLALMVNDVRDRDEKDVSRPFLSNVLNGHYDCSVPFAEDVANALDKKLTELLSAPAKKVRQTA